jgi:hypothetical protein
MIGKVVLEIVETFAKQGHSGLSAEITLAVLEKVLRFETLTPITDNAEDWMNVEEHYGPDMGGPNMWQCRRNPSLFSTDAGKTYYHVDKHTEIMASEHVSGHEAGQDVQIAKV